MMSTRAVESLDNNESSGGNISNAKSRGLDAAFDPHSVAVIGASDTPGKIGFTILANLKANTSRPVYAVNPNLITIMGAPCYASIGDVPAQVDLAVIATPTQAVPGVIEQCGRAGVGCAVVISTGFRETGAEGEELEKQILADAARFGMRLIGPNCLGIMIPPIGLNATFAASQAKQGSIAFLSQSGALCTAVLDWSLQSEVGFSAFVSAGSMADVNWGDLINYFGDDPYTKSIVLYMETVGDARAFMSAAREVALSKPIIVLKAGRTDAGSKAAISHTGAMTGADDALDAAFSRAGVLRVDSIAELFYMASILDRQPIPKGPNLTIITNAGGPAILAADSLLASGGALTQLSDTDIADLGADLPAHWSKGNPIDLLGDATPELYGKAAKHAMRDERSNGLLVILAPQAMTDQEAAARAIATSIKGSRKPVLTSWMGGGLVSTGRTILREAGIPTFPYPDTAARLFGYMWRHAQNLNALYETPYPVLGDDKHPTPEADAAAVIDSAVSSGKAILNEWESKGILRAYGIPVSHTLPATNEDDAVLCAETLGYPVVVKLMSDSVTHKSDAKGVQLDVRSAETVREAYRSIRENAERFAGVKAFQGVTVQPMISTSGHELIIGSHADSQLGPVVLFGSGGRNAELLHDTHLGLPPLTTALARQVMEGTKAYRGLSNMRGMPESTLRELERLMVRFSQLVIRHPRIKEIEINPLLASTDGIIALDARVILHSADVATESLPRPAIRAYPTQYVTSERLRDGADMVIRPVRPDDEPLVVDFHKRLSDRTVYLRFFHQSKLSTRISHQRLRRTCFLDYDREIALAAVISDGKDDAKIAAIGRLVRLRTASTAELAMVVADDDQGRGIGTLLINRLLEVAKGENIKLLRAVMLPDNITMQRLCKRLGFEVVSASTDSVVATMAIA